MKELDISDLLADFAKILILFVFVGFVYRWFATNWPTDLYGRPVTYFSDLVNGISQHPEWLAPNNWGGQYSGAFVWYTFIALTGAFILQHTPWWKRRSWPDLVDVPWQYVAGVLPILILFMAVIGVGANRAGFGYEQHIPVILTPQGELRIYQTFNKQYQNGTRYDLEISNYVYHRESHEDMAFVLTALVVPWNISVLAGKNRHGKDRISPRMEWLLIALVMLILFCHWETEENIGFPKQYGYPVLGAENPMDDTHNDMRGMINGMLLCFAFYQCTWMIANPPDKQFWASFRLQSKSEKL